MFVWHLILYIIELAMNSMVKDAGEKALSDSEIMELFE